MQDESGILITSVTLALEWQDDYLNWEHVPQFEFYKEFSIQMPKRFVWAPDIFIWNSAGSAMTAKMSNDSILRVSPTGAVSGEISMLIDTECEMLLLK